jgi:hypothetical protein
MNKVRRCQALTINADRSGFFPNDSGRLPMDGALGI